MIENTAIFLVGPAARRPVFARPSPPAPPGLLNCCPSPQPSVRSLQTEPRLASGRVASVYSGRRAQARSVREMRVRLVAFLYLEATQRLCQLRAQPRA